MNKYYETLTNQRGDTLPGYRAQVVTSAGSTVDIFADNSGTRFVDGNGSTVNYAVADVNGLVEFYWDAATGHQLQTLDASGSLARPAVVDFAIDKLGTLHAGLTTGALFTGAAALSIPVAITAIRTKGYSVAGIGGALYVYDAAVDGAYVTANPRTSFVETGGRGFRLSVDQTIKPTMFGAIGAIIDTAVYTANQAEMDASTDDTVALQAFFDFAFPAANASLTYDWSGHWAISSPLFLGRPLKFTTGAFSSTYHARRYTCGHLYVLPVASQPGGVPMTDVLTVMGPGVILEGEVFIHDGFIGTAAYADRRFKNGVKVLQATEGSIEAVRVNGAKRDAVHVDTIGVSWLLRAGSPYEVGSTSKNSIGLQIGMIYADGCGSTSQSAGYGYSTAWVGKVQGSDPAQNGIFVAGAGGYGGSAIQRTEIEVASTAEFEAGDFIKMRAEIPAATFTTIAADNATGKLTLAAGDGVTMGLAVGQVISLIDGGGVGVNDGVSFTIMAIGGTSNREVTVYPKPTTETAKAYTFIYTGFTAHKVETVTSATKFMVFPWVPDTGNSAVYLMQGYGLNVSGADGANIQAGYVGAFRSGGALRSVGLYGVHVNELLTDFVDIGAVIGDSFGAASIGTQIDHRHFEAAGFNVIQVAYGATWTMGDSSNSNLEGMVLLNSRVSTASPLSPNQKIRGFRLGHYGKYYDSRADYLGIALDLSTDAGAISNDPTQRERVFKADSGTVKVDFDRDGLRIDSVAEATMIWMGPTGVAPTGTATFSLSTRLADMGWTLAGSTSVATPGKITLFRLVFDDAARKVIIIHTLAA